MEPKTQIEISRWAAVAMLVFCLGNTLIVLFTFRNDTILRNALVLPIVLPNGVCVLFCACFFFALSHRLLKISLFLLIGYTLLKIWTFFSWKDFDAGDFFHIVMELFVLFVLWQGVIGIRREQLIQSGKVDTKENG